MNQTDAKMWIVAVAALALGGVMPVSAEVVTQEVTYAHGEVTLKGFVAYDDAVEGPRPGVLVVHEWWGLNDYARSRAKQLAELGYVALAVDMYGDAKTTEDPTQAQHWSGQFQGNDLMRQRAQAGLEVLAKHERVDAGLLAAIGYCFGGTTVLQLAYSGADVKAVVSFHSSLPLPGPEDMAKGRIKASILVCHGGDDAFVPAEHVSDFNAKLGQTDADWQFVAYGGAKHSFTNPNAGKFGIDGLAYDPNADRRSWRDMKQLFKEALAPPACCPVGKGQAGAAGRASAPAPDQDAATPSAATPPDTPPDTPPATQPADEGR